MKFETDPSTMKEIYSNHLQEICQVRFTNREIDVLSCLIHHRTAKKIAVLLAINPRTITSHVANIMAKLRSNSRDSIIDFVEKSGKIPYLRQYYLGILIQELFKNQLLKIGRINRDRIDYHLVGKAILSNNSLLVSLIKYLALANLHSVETKIDNLVSTIKNPYLYCASRTGANLDDHRLVLLFEHDLLPHIKYVDFRISKDFYHSTFVLIQEMIDHPKVCELTEEFEKEAQSLQASWSGLGQGVVVSEVPNSIGVSSPRKIIISTSIFLILMGSMIASHHGLNQNIPDVAKVIEDLNEYTKDFSADNLTHQVKGQNNYKLLNQVTKTVAALQEPQISSYFLSDDVKLEEILNCLYVMHALASQYINYEHNERKARPILLQAKGFAEHYVQRKSLVQIDFDELDREETFIEFNIVENLTAMYTRIIYLLGRTSVYSGDLRGCTKYFELSQYLGKKLGIFEGYLSSRSGLEVLQRQAIDDYIAGGQYEIAKSSLRDAIVVAQERVEDSQEYIINYGSSEVQKVTPKNDLFNRVYYHEQLAKYYTRLIWITEDAQENQCHLAKLIQLFSGNSSTKGLLDLSQDVTEKRFAAVLNSLGNIMLKLYDKQLDLTKFKQSLAKQIDLKLKSDHPLDFIADVFRMAKSKSRNTDYSKADSYDGLARAYEKKLALTIVHQEQQVITEAIKKFRAQRDNINEQLGRKNDKLRQHGM